MRPSLRHHWYHLILYILSFLDDWNSISFKIQENEYAGLVPILIDLQFVYVSRFLLQTRFMFWTSVKSVGGGIKYFLKQKLLQESWTLTTLWLHQTCVYEGLNCVPPPPPPPLLPPPYHPSSSSLYSPSSYSTPHPDGRWLTTVSTRTLYTVSLAVVLTGYRSRPVSD